MTFSVSAYRNELSPSDSQAIDFLKEDNILKGAHGKFHCCNLLDYEYDALQEAGFHLANNDVTTFPYYTADDKASYHIRKKTLRDSSNFFMSETCCWDSSDAFASLWMDQ